MHEHHVPTKRRRRMPANDTLVSCTMLEHAEMAIRRRIKLDRAHDIPYLAGYSRDGKTIYIDKDLPKSFASRGKRIYVDRYLVMHEAVEKTLIDQLGLMYQHAHQIALRAEEALVRAAGVSWKDYDNFMQKYIKEADDSIAKLPVDLDVKPYRDEHDTDLLHRMQAAMKGKHVKRVRVVKASAPEAVKQAKAGEAVVVTNGARNGKRQGAGRGHAKP